MSRVSRSKDEFYSMFSEFSALIALNSKTVCLLYTFQFKDCEVQIKNYETLR